MPDPEVRERPVRRTFTASYKLRIEEEAGAATEPGAVGTLLRREGLYSSHLVEWRRLYRAGALSGLCGHGAAWRSVESAAVRDAVRGLDHLRELVGAWATRLGAVVGDEAGNGLVDLTLANARRAAAPTVLDAAVALLYRNELSEPEHDVLLAPWLSIVAGQRGRRS
jgi:transposase-like protein